ncbi:MAG: 16S rRNA (guanine(966)-N(2))-methyltransferase RsmD [Pseudomonadota bacterium]|nr:16S rRNA (guanine(966)-N(2))-methyltransferase RsmD [Pseudomonadota bacterium]
MRIVAGRMRGLVLKAGEGRDIRPTSDRARESLFNLLAHGAEWQDQRTTTPAGMAVLDVFAGTGALGLEALSRGATEVGFIENDPAAQAVLRANLLRARAEIECRIHRTDALKPGRAPRSHDLVLLDPPYRQGMGAPALAALARNGWIAPGAIVVVETDAAEDFAWPDGFDARDDRKYGRARLRFARFRPGG